MDPPWCVGSGAGGRAVALQAGNPLSGEVKLTSFYFTAGITQTWAGYVFYLI